MRALKRTAESAQKLTQRSDEPICQTAECLAGLMPWGRSGIENPAPFSASENMIALSRRLKLNQIARAWFAGLAVLAVTAALAVGAPSEIQASERSAVRTVEIVNDRIGELLEKYAAASGRQTAASQAKLSGELLTILDRYLDIAAISQAVLGTAWRRATNSQRQEFQDAFTQYLAQKYSQHFPKFVGAEFSIADSAELKKNHYVVLVDATIADKTTGVKWYVLRRGGKSRVVNISVRDTNILSVERKVIRSLLQQRAGNLDRLNEYLPSRYSGTS